MDDVMNNYRKLMVKVEQTLEDKLVSNLLRYPGKLDIPLARSGFDIMGWFVRAGIKIMEENDEE